MSEPITRLVLIDRELRGTHVSVDLRINYNGDLIIDGYDTGSAPLAFWKSPGYEYITTVPAAYKDTILLLLLKDRFKDDSGIKKWLKAHDIPNSFWN